MADILKAIGLAYFMSYLLPKTILVEGGQMQHPCSPFELIAPSAVIGGLCRPVLMLAGFAVLVAAIFVPAPREDCCDEIFLLVHFGLHRGVGRLSSRPTT